MESRKNIDDSLKGFFHIRQIVAELFFFCFFLKKSCPGASHFSSQHVSSLAAGCNHVIILKSGQSPRNLPVTLFSRGILCNPALTYSQHTCTLTFLWQNYLHQIHSLIHHVCSPASGQMFFVVRRKCIISELWQEEEKKQTFKAFKNVLFVLFWYRNTDSRVPDVLMSVWDVAKQASCIVTMALHYRCYGFLICRMWFNQACHVLFSSPSAGLLLTLTAAWDRHNKIFQQNLHLFKIKKKQKTYPPHE